MHSPRVHVRFPAVTYRRLQETARQQGQTLSAIVRAALDATSGTAPPSIETTVISVRLPVEQLAALREEAAANGLTLSGLVRSRVTRYLASLARPASSTSTSRPSAQRAAGRRVTVPERPASPAGPRRRARRGRVALQGCAHTVSLADVEAAGGDGRVLCPKCETLRYPERP